MGKVVRTGAVMQVTGWALDPDTAAPIEVRVTNGLGLTTTATTNRIRGDMGSWAQYYGCNHGFDVTIAASVPSDTICVTMLNVGAGSKRLTWMPDAVVGRSEVGRAPSAGWRPRSGPIVGMDR